MIFRKHFTASALLIASALAVNITTYQPDVAYVPVPLPAPGPASHFEEIVSQFKLLGRTTVWNLVKKLPFEGDTGEPEGMINISEERYILGRGDWTEATKSYGKGVIINGTDRSPGAGYAHLLIYDGTGKRIADATLTQPGDIEYHIGGLDYDGQHIWATLAQYRPNTTGTIISIDPTTLDSKPVIHYRDHLGGIVHDISSNLLNTLNWGRSQRLYLESLFHSCPISHLLTSASRDPQPFLLRRLPRLQVPRPQQILLVPRHHDVLRCRNFGHQCHNRRTRFGGHAYYGASS